MISKDIKLILHERRFVFLTAVLVLITAVAILFGKSNSVSPRINLGVADNDGSEYTKLMLSYFNESESFSSYINIVEADEAELKRTFAEGGLDIYFVIPEGFTDNLIEINNVPMKVTVNSSDPTKAVVYKNLLESYSKYITAVELNCQSLYDIMKAEGYTSEKVDSENVAISYELLFTALGKDDFFKVNPIERFRGISLVNYYIYSAIVILVMYVGMFAGLSILREKISTANLRLRTLGIKRFKMITAKAFSYWLICGGLLIIVMIAVGLFADFAFSPGAIAFIAAAQLASCLVFSVMGMCFKTETGYIVFVNMLILLLTVVGGGIIPVMYLPEAMARVARFTPNYWFIKILL